MGAWRGEEVVWWDSSLNMTGGSMTVKRGVQCRPGQESGCALRCNVDVGGGDDCLMGDG